MDNIKISLFGSTTEKFNDIKEMSNCRSNNQLKLELFHQLYFVALDPDVDDRDTLMFYVETMAAYKRFLNYQNDNY